MGSLCWAKNQEHLREILLPGTREERKEPSLTKHFFFIKLNEAACNSFVFKISISIFTGEEVNDH
jgi:hypothetical protein